MYFITVAITFMQTCTTFLVWSFLVGMEEREAIVHNARSRPDILFTWRRNKHAERERERERGIEMQRESFVGAKSLIMD